MKRTDLITVMVQAFYGNRTVTEITPDDIDRLMLGWTDKSFMKFEKTPVDRTVIRVPGTDHLVLIYNKYLEEEERKRREKAMREYGKAWGPLACIPELGIELYSRCIAMRMDTQELPQSLQDEDYRILTKYLAE